VTPKYATRRIKNGGKSANDGQKVIVANKLLTIGLELKTFILLLTVQKKIF